MSKSAMVRARLEPDLKDRAENIFHRLGLNATQAITMFYKQVELRDGLPFNVAIPTTTTKRTIRLSRPDLKLSLFLVAPPRPRPFFCPLITLIASLASPPF